MTFFTFPESERIFQEARSNLITIGKSKLNELCNELINKNNEAANNKAKPLTEPVSENQDTVFAELNKKQENPAINKDKLIETFSKEKAISSIRVDSKKLDKLMNLVSEFITTQARLQMIANNINDPNLLNISESINKLSRQLRDNTSIYV